jgi:hypothetical protein
MNVKSASLDQIERWMQSVLMYGGEVTEAILSPEASQHIAISSVEELSSVVLPSNALDSSSRLEIYIDAYFERLLECLGQEFQATRAALGGENFNAVAFGYLRREPSHSYTLIDLGASFPSYLIETRLHERAAPVDATPTWGEFIVELASFERTLRDVFDGPGSEGGEVLGSNQLAAIPVDDWGRLRLLPAPCLRLVQFNHPVHRFWQDWKDAGAVAPPAPCRTHLAINRRAYSVERHELSHLQFALLERLLERQPLSEAIAATALQADAIEPRLEDSLQAWFARWIGERFFVGVEHADR